VIKELRNRRRALVMLFAALAAGAVLQFTNTNPAVSQSQRLSAYESPQDPGLDPAAAVWDRVSGIEVPLTAQAAAYSAGGSIKTVRLKAVHYRGRLFIRASWGDPTADDATTRVEDFSDAVALEFPASGVSTVPSVCMGQADAAVNIWHWRADSNAGLKDPSEVYTSASIDHFPVAFYTARDAGNPYANPNIGARLANWQPWHSKMSRVSARTARTAGPSYSLDNSRRRIPGTQHLPPVRPPMSLLPSGTARRTNATARSRFPNSSPCKLGRHQPSKTTASTCRSSSWQ
jgi:hypothetical protein